jgi:hypothetical protein
MDNKLFSRSTPRVFTSVTLKSNIGKRLRRTADFLNIDIDNLIDLLLDYADVPHIQETTINPEEREKFKKHTQDPSTKYAIEKDKYFKEGFKYSKRQYEW